MHPEGLLMRVLVRHPTIHQVRLGRLVEHEILLAFREWLPRPDRVANTLEHHVIGSEVVQLGQMLGYPIDISLGECRAASVGAVDEGLRMPTAT